MKNLPHAVIYTILFLVFATAGGFIAVTVLYIILQPLLIR